MKSKFILVLAFLYSIVLGAADSSAHIADELVTLESMGPDTLCGLNATGQSKCFSPWREKYYPPRTVGQLSHVFVSTEFSCGVDQAGLSCWVLKSETNAANAGSLVTRLQDFLKDVQVDSVQVGTRSMCGLSLRTNELRCSDAWDRDEPKIQIKPKFKILGFNLNRQNLCWADGPEATRSNPTPDVTVYCRRLGDVSDSKYFTLRGFKEIATLESGVCARSEVEGKCDGPYAGETQMAPESLTKAHWNSSDYYICILAENSTVQCYSSYYGQLETDAVPAQYRTPNPTLRHLWTRGTFACVGDGTETINCWDLDWSSFTTPHKFSDSIAYLFGSRDLPCAKLNSGEFECLHPQVVRPLQGEDRVKTTFIGNAYAQCYWNNSGALCPFETNVMNYRSVTAMAASWDYNQSVCVLGQRSSDAIAVDSVSCSGYSDEVNSVPESMDQMAALKIAVNNRRACAASIDQLQCWGDAFEVEPMPSNIYNPKRLEVADQHGCILDDFGFACWGDLATRKLHVPSDLQAPGTVIDFALGSGTTCMVLADQSVKCLGGSPVPANLTGVTSIIGRLYEFCARTQSGVRCWGSTDFPK